MKLNSNELINIYGGWSISGTLLNSISKAVSYIFEFGRTIGSSIRYAKEKKICKL